MHIAMLLWSDRSQFGGRTLQTKDLSDALRRLGIRTTILDARRPSRHMFKVLAAADIVHAQGGVTPIIGLLARSLARRRQPIVCTLHGWHIRGIRVRIENAVERIGLYGCAALTTPNGVMIGSLPRRLRARTTRVPNGVPDRMPVVSNISTSRSRAPRILWIGRVAEAKGIDVALEAHRLAKNRIPDLELVVVGEADPSWIHPGLLAGVTFVGGIIDPWSSFRGEILLHTPRYDACPRAVLEAMAEGSAVVATRVGGIPELIRHDDNGLLAEDGDAAEISEHLVTLARNLGTRTRYVQAARIDFDRDYTIDTMAKRMLGVYEEVLA